MKIVMLIVVLTGAMAFCGCSRVGSLTRSVARNQKDSAGGVVYTDSLFTDDGRSRLTGRQEEGVPHASGALRAHLCPR